MSVRALSPSPWPKKRKRVQVRKPTIRWEVLGLSAPENKEVPSIESIRRAVSAMASRGLGQGVRAQAQDVESEGEDLAGARGVRRRGATE
jgi:hypothetical protein